MADDLKKVGLVFKADGAVDFIKTNQAVNSSLKENYQQFRLTQVQWDESTKSSQKLRDKLVYLNSAYDIQKDKVRLLKTELSELEQKEGTSTAEIGKKKAAVAQAEAQLGAYEKQIKKTSKEIESGTSDLKDFADKLDNVSGKVTDAGKKMSVFTAAYGAATGLAVKASMDFESAIAGVNKTIDGTPEQLDSIKKGIRNMAKEIPASTTEISAVAEAAGQLGIQTDNVLDFTRVMIDMGNATNLSAEEGATTLARFANVTKMSQKDFSRLGSSIVALGNNFATTESEIAAMAMNLGSAGTQVGMTQSDILALATALSSVGLEAQAGGTSFSKAMIKMQLAVETGSEELQDFARVAGMTGEEFSKLFKEDATGALMAFIDGLSKTGDQGESAIKVLDDMGITETRLRDSLLRSANASEIFSEAIGMSSDAWSENTALTDEAAMRYATTESQMKVLKNTINDLAISFGDLLLPKVQSFIEKLKDVVDFVNQLDPVAKSLILTIGGIVAAIGPILIVIGQVGKGVATLIKAFVFLKPIIGPMFVAAKAAVVGFAATLGLPVAAIVAIGVAVVALVALMVKYWDEIKAFTIDVFNSISSTVSKIFNSIGTYIGGVFENVKAIVKDVFTSMTAWFEPVIESLKQGISNFHEFFSNTIGTIADFFKNTFENIKKTLSSAIAIMVENIQAFVTSVLEFLDWPIQFIKNALLLVVALLAIALETIYTTVIQPLVDFFVTAFQAISLAVSEKLAEISAFFDATFTAIKEFVGGILTNIVEFFTTSFNAIKEFVEMVLTHITDFFQKSFDWVMTTVINPFTEMMKNVFDTIKEHINNVINNIREFFRTGFEFVKVNVITPLIDFFSSIFNNIQNIISGVVENIKTAFSNMKWFIIETFENVKATIQHIFSTVVGIIKAPINGAIELINGALRSLNRIKVPSWVPGLGGAGINFPMISYLATGGDLISGAAIVGEMGPELLMQGQGRSKVVPLTESGKHNATEIIDYKKLGYEVARAMQSLKFTMDDDGFGKFVDNRLIEVM